MHFCCIIFNFVLPNVCLKHHRVSCFIVLCFWRKVLEMSYKVPKVTLGGWCSPDVARTSILNISTKCISVVTFSVLVYQMCVLDTKKLVISYSFILEKRPKYVLKTFQSDTSCVTSLERPQDVNLIIIHEIGF